MLRLRDGFLLFVASLERILLSAEGFLFGFVKFLRVYRASRGTSGLHYRQLTTSRINGGCLYHRRRAAHRRRRWRLAGLGVTTIIVFVILGLHSRSSEAHQGG